MVATICQTLFYRPYRQRTKDGHTPTSTRYLSSYGKYTMNVNFQITGKNPNFNVLNTLAQRYDQLEEDVQKNGFNEEHLARINECLLLVDDVLRQEIEFNDNTNILGLFNFRTQLIQQHDTIKSFLQKVVVKKREPTNTSSMETKNPTLIDSLKIIPNINGLDDVAGLVEVKKELISSIVLPMYQPQLFKKFQICKSILLYGPPGTGKTRLTHALAAEIKADLYSASASSILSSYIGETEQNLRLIFQGVMKCTTFSIIFLDEIDGLCRARNDGDSDASRRFKTEMMCQLNALDNCENNIYFICATNCPWDLDVAFMRRFNRKLYVPLPNSGEIYEFLHFFSKNTPLINTTSYWNSAINHLNGYSGADIANVVRYALNLPLKELLDAKSWKIEDGKYKPADICQDTIGKAINCSIQQLPRNSVQARDPHYVDLLTAIHTIPKSTTDEQLKKYINYV